MAIAVTVIKRSVFGDQRIVIADIVFSGNYATGGEAVAASDLGLNVVNHLNFDGAAFSSADATALAAKYNHSTGKVLFYESGASGAALAEKTNAEAYPTSLTTRIMAVGN